MYIGRMSKYFCDYCCTRILTSPYSIIMDFEFNCILIYHRTKVLLKYTKEYW